MILALTDKNEAIYLSLVLKSVDEKMPLEELLLRYTEEEKVPEILEEIEHFVRSKLGHPILSIALKEMDALLRARELKRAGKRK